MPLNHTHQQRSAALRGKAVRWNLFCNVADGGLASLCFVLVSPAIVVPAFLREAGASDTTIGLISALTAVAALPISVLLANYVQALRRKKPYVLIVGIFERLHFFLVPLLAILFLPARSRPFLILYTVSAWTQSAAWHANGPAWTDLVAKVIPIEKRGFLFGWSHGIGALLAVPFFWAIRWVLARYAFPHNYALLYLAGGLSFLISLAFVAMIRERAKAVEPVRRSPWQSLRAIPAVLRKDRGFAWFVLSQGLVAFASGMVGQFLILTAADRFSLPVERLLPSYLMVSYLTAFIGNLLFGRLGDRYGHKRNLLIAIPLFVATCAAAILARTPLAYGSVFVLGSLCSAAFWLSIFLIVMEFGGELQRPRYMAIHTTVLTPLVMFGAWAGGFLRDQAGATPNFIAAILLALVGGWILLVRVKDPRVAAKHAAEKG